MYFILSSQLLNSHDNFAFYFKEKIEIIQKEIFYFPTYRSPNLPKWRNFSFLFPVMEKVPFFFFLTVDSSSTYASNPIISCIIIIVIISIFIIITVFMHISGKGPIERGWR